MAQFDVHKLRDELVLDCQAHHLSDLATRFVVPLRAAGSGFPVKSRLNPIFEIDGEPVVMMTEFAAAVSKRHLGASIVSLANERDKIIAALDLLITGV